MWLCTRDHRFFLLGSIHSSFYGSNRCFSVLWVSKNIDDSKRVSIGLLFHSVQFGVLAIARLSVFFFQFSPFESIIVIACWWMMVFRLYRSMSKPFQIWYKYGTRKVSISCHDVLLPSWCQLLFFLLDFKSVLIVASFTSCNSGTFISNWWTLFVIRLEEMKLCNDNSWPSSFRYFSCIYKSVFQSVTGDGLYCFWWDVEHSFDICTHAASCFISRLL